MAAKSEHVLATHFLNVDLDIYSRVDLRPLLDGFGRKVHVLYAGKVKGKFQAHLEVAKHTTDADTTIRTFCKFVEALPVDVRRLWNKTTVRSFSIGIQAGTHPNSSDFVVGPKAVKAVSNVGAQIVCTVYAPSRSRK